MARDEIRGPDLAGVVADANAVGLEHVVAPMSRTPLRDDGLLEGSLKK
jgi:hypothetical protein